MKLLMVSAVVSFYAFTSCCCYLTSYFAIINCLQILCDIHNLQPVATDAITFIDGVYVWTQLFMTLWTALSADH